MNTLPPLITTKIFGNRETYNGLRSRWSSLMQSNQKLNLAAAHHLLYLALMGKDWRRAFTPPSNPRKLQNGAFYDWELFRALGKIHNAMMTSDLLAPLDGIITPGALGRIREFLPKASPYTCKHQDFEKGEYSFDAYNVPEEMASQHIEKDLDHA
jgi:hypothetical protein